MVTPTFQFLPIDGFSYETSYGLFCAEVVRSPSTISNLNEVHKVEIEFLSECHGYCLIRRLTLWLSQADVERNRGGIYRLIQAWVFADPSAEDYFAYECCVSEALEFDEQTVA
jgi:hypothetical protein